MIIDFTKMTIYELFALILATIAILIPVIQWAWKKWIIKPRLSFYPTGQAMLFFNQSGSYIRLNGVLESKNKAITLKKLCLKITRKKDDKKLNLTWSTLISPVNQSIVGGIAQTAQTTEAAHPIRVDADRIVCVFAEYSDSFDSFGKKFRENTKVLFEKIPQYIQSGLDYDGAKRAFQDEHDYSTVYNELKTEFYWDVGEYKLDLDVDYDNTSKHFSFELVINEQDHRLLSANVEESLMTPLKIRYFIPQSYNTAIVEIKATGT